MTALGAGGLILAGGRSTRFGGEKAVAKLGGRPLLAWGLAALAPICEAVAVCARLSSGADALGLALGCEVLTDDPSHPAGPLAGVAAGLAWASKAGFDLLVTLPCDTPLIGTGEIGGLIAALGDAPAAYALTADGPHGLCAVWRTSAAAALSARLAAGDHPSVRSLLDELGAVAARFDDARPFRNINTPTDLAIIQSEVAVSSPPA
jgi:molybdopterin-guanine dinucleotide biosynthesis protein A